MTQEQLVQQVAEATRRETAAGKAAQAAASEAQQAARDLQVAWTALREYQDGLVARAVNAG